MQLGGDAMEVTAAYRHCEEITWSQARNFSYGIRLLPPDKRRALAAVYAFARRIDDIGDGTLPSAEKLAALAEARASVTALAGGATPAGPGAPEPRTPDAAGPAPVPADLVPADLVPADPVLVALADAGRRFPIPLEVFGELIDGCEADVRGTSYGTFDDLRNYCRCVAGSIGRLSLGVFGARDMAKAAPLADELGVALQLTNILRDIREDYRDGRIYLPAEDFKRFGTELRSDGSGWPAADPKLVDLVVFEAERARDWYSRGLRLMPMLDRRSAACTGAMAGIYFRLLQNIAAAPELVLQRRVSLSPGQKAMVAVKSLAGTALRPGASRSATTTGASR
jgi:15-cis-phytoene synthase